MLARSMSRFERTPRAPCRHAVAHEPGAANESVAGLHRLLPHFDEHAWRGAEGLRRSSEQRSSRCSLRTSLAITIGLPLWRSATVCGRRQHQRELVERREHRGPPLPHALAASAPEPPARPSRTPLPPHAAAPRPQAMAVRATAAVRVRRRDMWRCCVACNVPRPETEWGCAVANRRPAGPSRSCCTGDGARRLLGADRRRRARRGGMRRRQLRSVPRRPRRRERQGDGRR